LEQVARVVATVVIAIMDRGRSGPDDAERRDLAGVVDANAARFLDHLSRRSTAELWESFAVPWGYAEVLTDVRSGCYAERVEAAALWAVQELVAMFTSDTPPRTANAARKRAALLDSQHGGSLLP